MTGKESAYLINAFKGPLLSLFKDFKDEASYFINDGLEAYLNNIGSKFSRTKTFLYRNENVKFEDVFFPVSLSLRSNSHQIHALPELFKSSRFATIIGNAGSGKTMLMKHFFLTSIDTQFRIPLIIELRNLNDFDGNLIEYIYQGIFNNRLSPNKKILERLLSSGKFIFLLDGYDEIFSIKKSKITNDLDDFIDKYNNNNFIISSRPNSGIESFPRFNNYFVQPLNKNEISDFIDLQLKYNYDSNFAEKIKTTIARPENEDYTHFLSSPLLLSMFILTFESYPELPKKKSKFYWNVFDTLSTRHDSFTKRGGYQHERKTGLQNDEFENVLKWFSFISLFEGKYSFDAQYLTTKLDNIKHSLNLKYSTPDLIEDLTLSIAIIIVDGIEFKFPHKSLQEYFCALLIKSLPQNQKEQVYSKKLSLLHKESLDSNENFWNLCSEIDRTSFVKYFLIPQITNFYSTVSSKLTLETVRFIYGELMLREQFYPTPQGYKGMGSTSRTSTTLQALEYVGISFKNILNVRNYLSQYNERLNIFLNDHFPARKEPAYSSARCYIVYSSEWNTKLESLFYDIGLVDAVANQVEQIKFKIKELEDEVIQEEVNNINLLNI